MALATASAAPIESTKRVVYVALVGSLLVTATKLGERADRRLSDSILRIAEAASPLSRANGVLTVQLALDQVLAGLSLQFPPDLRATQIEESVIDIERQIRASHPEVVTLFIKPQTDATWKEAIRQRFGSADTGRRDTRA